MAVMSIIFNDSQLKVDNNKLIRMSLIHDMAECIVGDITPFDGIDAKQKHLLESNAMNYLGIDRLFLFQTLIYYLVYKFENLMHLFFKSNSSFAIA